MHSMHIKAKVRTIFFFVFFGWGKAKDVLALRNGIHLGT
jgi:hypothetical protein